MNYFRQFAIAAAGGAMLTAACAFSAPAFAAGPEVVAGPSADPQCFVPWSDKTKFFKCPAKKGPFRIALANGFIANTWRIQMIQTAKAFAAQPDIAAQLKEFKVVSTGEDVAAQIAAINNFIDSGYRRDRHRRAEPRGVQARHQARQGRRRRAGRLRQHSRHRRRDQRRRRPEGPRRLLGEMARKPSAQRRQDPRSARRLRHFRRQATVTTASTRRSTRPARSGTSSRSTASGTIRPRRR